MSSTYINIPSIGNTGPQGPAGPPGPASGLQWASPYTKTFTDFSDASSSKTITLFSESAKEMIHQIVIKPTVAFGGGTISAYTISIGVSGNNAKYATAYDVFQTVTDTEDSSSVSTFGPESFAGATAITITATCVGDTLDNATTGSVGVYVLTSTLP